MGEGECLMLYMVVKNDCVNSKGFPSAYVSNFLHIPQVAIILINTYSSSTVMP